MSNLLGSLRAEVLQVLFAAGSSDILCVHLKKDSHIFASLLKAQTLTFIKLKKSFPSFFYCHLVI